MNLSQLTQTAGKISTGRKRRGRGPASGLGKTAGRGHKGAKARKSFKYRDEFEGGQMPMVRRQPKRGFNNKNFSKEFAVANTGELERTFEDGATIGPAELLAAGIVNRVLDGIKVLAKGSLTKKLHVTAHKFSTAAAESIKAAGGTVTVVTKD
jgi:large subunit ribosomal protein L15